MYPGAKKDKRNQRNGITVRVIEYTLEGVADAEPFYRVITTILDADKCPAQKLTAVYHDGREVENSLGELKIQLRGSRIVLRRKTTKLVSLEYFGFMMAHFASRGLMHEAALKADGDPDKLSF